MTDSSLNQRRGQDALLLCGDCDLEQCVPTHIHWKQKFGLVLHHNLKSVIQGIDSYPFSSGRQRREIQIVTPSTQPPEANDHGLWTPRTSRNR